MTTFVAPLATRGLCHDEYDVPKLYQFIMFHLTDGLIMEMAHRLLIINYCTKFYIFF